MPDASRSSATISATFSSAASAAVASACSETALSIDSVSAAITSACSETALSVGLAIFADASVALFLDSVATTVVIDVPIDKAVNTTLVTIRIKFFFFIFSPPPPSVRLIQ